MTWAFKQDGDWKPIVGAFTIGGDGDPNALHFAPDWIEKSTPEEKVGYGVFEAEGPGDQPQGVIVAGTKLVDDNGRPKEIWLTEPYPLDELRTMLLAQLDAQAEAVRLQYITPGTGQGMTYQYKVSEALAWTADNSASVPFLSAEAEARGITIADLVAEVQGNAAAWTVIGAKIEAARMGAKTAVRDAASAASMIAAAAVDWQGVTT